VIDFFCSLDNFNTVLFSATTTSICGTWDLIESRSIHAPKSYK
jgi:hypothetical protein